jgi:predicted DNA-binding transcriptional regulator AlpA
MPQAERGIEREFLRRKEAAEFIAMSPEFLRKAEREGTGPKVSRLGRAPVYKISDLRDWVASRAKDGEAK